MSKQKNEVIAPAPETGIQLREQNAVALAEEPKAEILQSDLIVPYVVLGQGLSEAVKDRKVQLGDIYRSTNAEVLGNPDKPIEVIFLTAPKADWVLEQKNKGGKFEFRKREERNAANETLAWSFWADDDGNWMEPGSKGATEWRRVKRLTSFAILPQDIDAFEKELAKAQTGELPDPSKALTPVVISFRSSSYKAGKEIATFHAQARSMKAFLWQYRMPMGTNLEQNDQGSFYVWAPDRTKTKAVSKDHLVYVKQWVDMLTAKADTIIIDDAGEAANEGATSQPRDVSSKTVKDVC